MKLVITAILIINYTVYVNSNEFIFPPKFQTPGTFVSESSMYLPPESHTPIPYFPVKKFNNLPFPYLPPSGTKSPVPFPTQFPILLSSNGPQNFDDDDDDKNDNEPENKNLMSTPRPPFPYNRNNKTENGREEQMYVKRDMRQIHKPLHYQQPIDRIDVRVPNKFPSGFSTPMPMNQNPTARSMIISETHRNDNIFDQLKSGSSLGGHFVQPPGSFISPTTEPAIPILRLSNEMDLDGSFSYEALGADQTHYVQHSHMENQGTEKEEQVVEGSYSYVGDNGQTYTVHYVADSNGFRASGDHLPVAPPIPEIIQRAIQYNLAEEAKKPPHLKSWQADEQERDYNEIHDKSQRFGIPPPPRNLFTGRTPEAFSYDFSQNGQRSNTQNNLEAAASSQSVVKTVDFTNNQQKPNINAGPIAPQVTFLASQGAHVPSINNPQQTVSRMFTNEKPLASLPQLVNYEADDNNKALWRWQYGLNSNNQINNNVNQTPEKNSISRSSGDDVVINFNEMSPEQYTKMLQSQIATDSMSNVDSSARHFANLPAQENINHPNNDFKMINANEHFKYHQNNQLNTLTPTTMQTTQSQNQQYSEDWYKNLMNNNHVNNQYSQQTNSQELLVNNHQENSVHEEKSTTDSQQEQNLINSNVNTHTPYPHFQEIYTKQDTALTHKDNSEDSIDTFSTLSQTKVNSNTFVTQSYNFEDVSYEPRRIKALNQYTTIKPSLPIKNYITNDDYNKINTPSYSTHNLIDLEKGSTLAVTQAPVTTITSTIKFTDFISPDSNDSFKPIIKTTIEEKPQESKDDIDSTDLSNNIFLKNAFKPKKPQPEVFHKFKENTEKQTYKKVSNAETKSDKVAKYINVQSKPLNDLKINNKNKPIDISEIINYINMKSHFESGKINKPKNNLQSFETPKHKNEMHYAHIDDDEDDDDFESYSQKQNNNGVDNVYPQRELRGNIKNYKVLQRNNNLSNGYHNELKRELAPPPMKLMQSQNLPPLGRAGPSTRSYLPPIYV